VNVLEILNAPPFCRCGDQAAYIVGITVSSLEWYCVDCIKKRILAVEEELRKASELDADELAEVEAKLKENMSKSRARRGMGWITSTRTFKYPKGDKP
jgi:hypothetical protein